MFHRPFAHPPIIGYNYWGYTIPFWNGYYGNNYSNIDQRIDNFGYMNDVTQNAIVTQENRLGSNLNYTPDILD